VSSDVIEAPPDTGEPLTKHQQDQAGFGLSCTMHGKLKSVDKATAHNIVRFARSSANPFPGKPVPSLVIRPRNIVVTTRGPSREAGPRRSGGAHSSRGSPDDDPSKSEPQPRHCRYCGDPLVGRRRQAKWCNESHRLRAYRLRRREQAAVETPVQNRTRVVAAPEPASAVDLGLKRRHLAAIRMLPALDPDERVSMLAAVVWPGAELLERQRSRA
jgi:hypothetical protein